jgi:hypothetical protein
MDLISNPMQQDDFFFTKITFFLSRESRLHLTFCKYFGAIARVPCRILVCISLERCCTRCRKHWQILKNHNLLRLQILTGFQDREKFFKMATTTVAFCLRPIFRAKQHESKRHEGINNILLIQFSSLGFIWTRKTFTDCKKTSLK